MECSLGGNRQTGSNSDRDDIFVLDSTMSKVLPFDSAFGKIWTRMPLLWGGRFGGYIAVLGWDKDFTSMIKRWCCAQKEFILRSSCRGLSLSRGAGLHVVLELVEVREAGVAFAFEFAVFPAGSSLAVGAF